MSEEELRVSVDRAWHQLSNPLHAIVVNLEAIRVKTAGMEELEPFLRAVQANVERLDRRLRLLVSVARRGSGGERLQERSLARLARDVAVTLGLEGVEGEVVLELPEDETLLVRAREGSLVACLVRFLLDVQEGSPDRVVRSRVRDRRVDLEGSVLPGRLERLGRLAGEAGGELEPGADDGGGPAEEGECAAAPRKVRLSFPRA